MKKEFVNPAMQNISLNSTDEETESIYSNGDSLNLILNSIEEVNQSYSYSLKINFFLS